MNPLELLKIGTEISLGAVLAVVLGVLVYVLGSFALMRPHTTSRTLGLSMRELLREVILASITQPFLPLYYLIGKRMEPLLSRRVPLREGAVPVVFVHGYMQNRVGFLGLARALARRGIGPLYGFNYPWFASIASNAKRLERFVQSVCKETKHDAIDLVCHSMGGLVAMEMMRVEAERWRQQEKEHEKEQEQKPLATAESNARAARENARREMNVRRCVTIATPHGGVAWRGPILGVGATSLRRGSQLLSAHAGYSVEVPTLSVFSSHDNIVHPKETAQLAGRGGKDVEVDGVAHLSILFSPAVAEHVALFLSEPGPSGAIVRPRIPASSSSSNEENGKENGSRGNGDERERHDQQRVAVSEEARLDGAQRDERARHDHDEHEQPRERR